MKYVNLYRNKQWFKYKQQISKHFLRWLIFDTIEDAKEYQLYGYECIRNIPVNVDFIDSDKRSMQLFPSIEAIHDGCISYPTTL